jgi:hypothetical protein
MDERLNTVYQQLAEQERYSGHPIMQVLMSFVQVVTVTVLCETAPLVLETLSDASRQSCSCHPVTRHDVLLKYWWVNRDSYVSLQRSSQMM